MSIEESSQTKPSGFSSVVLALFFFVLFAALALILIRRGGPEPSVDATRAAARIAIREALKKSDDEKLVGLPAAKEAVLAELQHKVVAPSSVKVEAPLPPVAAADPNSAEPPAVALTSSPQGADTIRFDPPATQPVSTATPEIKK